MKKRYALLALLLVFSTLFCMVSCSKGGEGEGTTASNPSDPGTPGDPGSEYVAPNVNYNGESVTIASYSYEGAWKILSYNVAETEDQSDSVSQAIVKRNSKVESELGVLVDLYPLDSWDRGNSEKIQNDINKGNQSFDFALAMSASIAPLLQVKGMLVDLNTVKTLDLAHSWWNQNANTEYSLYGHQYAAVGDLCLFNTVAPIVTYFNKNMIESYGLENPYDLASKGTWTLEKMMDMATAVADNLDENELIEDVDQFGFCGEIDSLMYLLFSTGVRMTGRDNNGNITLTLNTEKTINAVDKIQTILQDKDVSRVMGGSVSGEKYNSFHNDYAIPKMESNQLLFMSFQLYAAMDMGARGIQFGLIPSPKYDILQNDYISFSNSWFSDHLIIPATNDNVDMTGHVIEAMGYYAQQYITPEIIDVSVRSRGVRDDISAMWVEKVIDVQIFEIGYIYNWGNLCGMFSDMAADNTEFSASYKGAEETAIGELMDTILDMQQ